MTSGLEYAIGRMLYSQGFRSASRPTRIWLVLATKCSSRMEAQGECRISSGGAFAVDGLQDGEPRSSSRSGRRAAGVSGALEAALPTGTQTPRCSAAPPSERFDCSSSGHEHASSRTSQPRQTGLRSSHFFRRRRQHRQPVLVRVRRGRYAGTGRT